MKHYHAWVEDVASKKILAAYVGPSYMAVHMLVDTHGSTPEREVFLHDSSEPDCYWWKGSEFKWVKCNWDCKVPENLAMRILVGAL